MNDKQLPIFEGEEAPAATAVKKLSFTLSRTLRGDAQTAIDQWLIPVFIGRWMFGEHAGDEEVLELNNTVRRGGDFCYETLREGQRVQHSGDFEELRIPSRLVCSWRQSDLPGVEMHVSVLFESLTDKTRMKLQCLLPESSEALMPALKTQWNARCDALAARLKTA